MVQQREETKKINRSQQPRWAAIQRWRLLSRTKIRAQVRYSSKLSKIHLPLSYHYHSSPTKSKWVNRGTATANHIVEIRYRHPNREARGSRCLLLSLVLHQTINRCIYPMSDRFKKNRIIVKELVGAVRLQQMVQIHLQSDR